MVKIFTDSLHRLAYATDASAYREVPLGVAYPETDDDIRELIEYAARKKTCLIPRAGGTSIAGQVVGNGIVVDISRHFNRILQINEKERWAWVQPGVVRDELNLTLRQYGLFFSPETSTSNRCCIGGMVGNNSCGTHSLIYGSTRHHVLGLKGFLSDGSRFNTDSREGSGLLGRIYAQLEGWADDPAARKIIEDNFPDRSLQRRSCGYALDEALNGPDLCKLLCGSEGTLAFITEIRVSLDTLPPERNMVLCAHCKSLEDSYIANLTALKHKPVAVELIDGKILQLAKGNLQAARNRFFVQGDPEALLIIEFNGDDMDACADRAEKDLVEQGLAYCCTRVYGSEVNRVWDLRKAGLGVLGGMKGDAKPVGVIEDTAVAPERLPAYLKDFGEMMDGLGLDCVFYGHIGTGELHLRPILNLKDEEDRKKFREVASRTAALVRKHKGSLSGEHGDGRLRGEFIPQMYGTECYEMLRQVKHLWDPDNIFNAGKIIDTPPMDEFLRFEAGQSYKADMPQTVRAVEQCNGAGDCRKSNLIGGTLCPAFKVSGRDELMSTRARANILREALTRGIDGRVLDSPEVREILYSCLACKGCKGECPSNVDMTAIRSRVLQEIYRREGTPLRAWMVARMARFESLGSLVAPLYNFAAGFRPSAAIIKKMVGFAPERQIPKIYRRRIKGSAFQSERKVCLFVDEFTRYQEPQLALDFKALLEALGYQVIVPKVGESGRAAISKGCLDLASGYARRNVLALRGIVSEDIPLVGIEPSCILSFRDEYPSLVGEDLREDAVRLGANALLYDEFLMREAGRGRFGADNFKEDKVEIWLHGHCHQKALVGIGRTADMLRLLKGATLHVIPSGCCGMAGSFGYEKEHYRTSLAIGEMVLFPAVRRSLGCGSPAMVAAPGTSCRQQILDGTGVKAVHPIQIMLKWLK